MMKVAITGSTGLVGSRIVELLADDFQFIPLQQPQIDITQKEPLADVLNSLDFDILIHLAAYTNVDGAEKDRETAMSINVNGTRNIFNVVSQMRKKLIYISTDFVFDGATPPYTEYSTPNPISVYGSSKYEGEKLIGNKGMIVRISYPYRKDFNEKKDFVRTIKSLLEQNRQLNMVSDSLITPTLIDDIALALRYLMLNWKSEVFHITGSQALSPFDAGVEIAQAYGLNEQLIVPVSYDQYFRNKAQRPRLSDMRSVKNTFTPMKSLHEGLQFIKKKLL